MKKIILFIVKLAVMLALLAGAAYAALFIAFASGSLPLFFVIMAVIAVGLIAFGVWLSRLGTEKPPKDAPFLKKAQQPFLLLAATAAAAALYGAYPEIADTIKEARAKAWVKAADEIVCYQNNGDINVTIMNTGLYQSSAAIDYSKMCAAFIYTDTFDEAERVRLKRTGSLPVGNVQFKAELSDPGKTFYTYHKSGDYRMTSGVGIEMADGDLFYASVDKFLDFDGISGKISDALKTADLVFPYGKNPLPALAMGLKTDSVLVDLDELTLSVVYRSSGGFREVTDQDYEYFSISEIPLKKADGGAYPVKQHTEDCKGYKLYGYREDEPQDWNENRSDGFVLVTPDGEMLEAEDWGYYNWEMTD